MNHRAIRDDCDLAAVTQQLTLSEFEQAWFSIDRHTHTVSPRVTHRDWSDVFDHRQHHVAHFTLIFGRHQDNIRHRAKVCDVDQPVVCRTITTGDATAIETELHIQILNAHVMDQLVETPLEKGGVD